MSSSRGTISWSFVRGPEKLWVQDAFGSRGVQGAGLLLNAEGKSQLNYDVLRRNTLGGATHHTHHLGPHDPLEREGILVGDQKEDQGL